jgi:hypothetical protein
MDWLGAPSLCERPGRNRLLPLCETESRPDASRVTRLVLGLRRRL